MQNILITPTPDTFSGGEVTEVINAMDRTANTFQEFTFGLAVLFVVGLAVIALIAYFYFNRNASKGAVAILTTFAEAMGTTNKEKDERIDKLEAKEIEREERQVEGNIALSNGLNRIADLWQAEQKRETERDRILSDLTSGVTAIVTVGSKPLQQVVKDVSELQKTSAEIQRVVSLLYDKFMLRFPDEEAIEQVRVEFIDAVNKVSEQKKGDTGEQPRISDSKPIPPLEASPS